MKMLDFCGHVDRRILVNYRIDPQYLQCILPAPFRPHCINGSAIGGLCLIRLRQTRPRGWPALLGIQAENIAYRFAVEWDEGHQTKRGAFILRRDTSSPLLAWTSGWLMPTRQYWSRFEVNENDNQFKIQASHRDGTKLVLNAQLSTEKWTGKCFDCQANATDFFEQETIGYTPTANGQDFIGMGLEMADWTVNTLSVQQLQSTYFDDPRRFPLGSIKFDHAFVLQNSAHQMRWKDKLTPSPRAWPSRAA